MRSQLIAAEIIDDSAWAWEGRSFDPGTLTAYVAEVVQADGGVQASTTLYGAQITFSYNVYTRAPDSAGSTNTETSYYLTTAIGRVFSNNSPVTLDSGETVIINRVSARVATENKGWRLAPVDITVRVEKSKVED